MWISHKDTIDYSDFGDVVFYSGPRGNGKTLAAIRQLVEEPDSRGVVTNLGFLTLPHEPLDSSRLLEYRDRRLLIDNFPFFVDSRHRVIDTIWRRTLQLASKQRLQIIMTGQRYESIPVSLRNHIDSVIIPEYYYGETLESDSISFTHYTVHKPDFATKYPSFEAKPYFQYYDTLEPILMNETSLMPRTRGVSRILLVGPEARLPNKSLLNYTS